MRLEYTAGEIIKYHLISEWREGQDKPDEKISNVNETFEKIKGSGNIIMDHLIESFRCSGGQRTGKEETIFGYDFEERAVKCSDGWIGWKRLHGCGGNSDSGDYPWLDEAVFLDVVDEKKITTIERTFERNTRKKMPLSLLPTREWLG